MRRLVVALALVGLVSDASAADYELPDLPTLRGSSPFVPAPPTFTRWSGFYAGGQAGYGDAHVEFSRSTQQLLQFVLRELALESEQHVSLWKVLGPVDKSGYSFGAFVGYNSQWDDIILGVDLTYSVTSFKAVSPVSPISRRTTAGGNVYDVTVFGSGTMKIHDWGSARVRAGWAVDNLMPYATVGFAFGRADITRSATATGEENPPDPPETCATDVTPPICVPFTFTKAEGKRNAWLFGWTAGGGLDYLILPNVFLRGEYEYVSFAGVSGTKASINTARVGAGYRF